MIDENQTPKTADNDVQSIFNER